MLPGNEQKHNFTLNKARQKDLISAIKTAHPDKDGVIVICAGFEGHGQTFTQESSFYYLTGITEPGVVMMIDLQGTTTLYIPNCGPKRGQWVQSEIELTQANAKTIGVNTVKELGVACAGYQFYPFFPQSEYEYFLKDLQGILDKKQSIFTLNPENSYEYVEQRLILNRLETFIPGIKTALIDISPLVAAQRRTKDMDEINTLLMAGEITIMAQEAACNAIEEGAFECEVQAGLEYIFTASGCKNAFPSIVATGKNATVLHYTKNDSVLKNGELVVVDIGVKYKNYCADVTRTYPVSGTFTKRQKELYNIVLATQEYIESIAAPGYWLNNPEHPEKSLQHLAKKFMAQKGGYDKYFIHGIGHFLGLDVHDVGDAKKPLAIGDVFTIEPGIYIPEENIGIRIEDDYWLAKDGIMCLTEGLPKKAEQIESMMHEDESDEADFDEYDIDESDQTTQA